MGDNPAKDFQAPQQLGMIGAYFHNIDVLYASVTKESRIENITDVKNNLRGCYAQDMLRSNNSDDN